MEEKILKWRTNASSHHYKRLEIDNSYTVHLAHLKFNQKFEHVSKIFYNGSIRFVSYKGYQPEQYPPLFQLKSNAY